MVLSKNKFKLDMKLNSMFFIINTKTINVISDFKEEFNEFSDFGWWIFKIKRR